MVWPMIAGLFGSLLGGGAAAGAGAAAGGAAAGGAGGGVASALGGLLGGGGSSGADALKLGQGLFSGAPNAAGGIDLTANAAPQMDPSIMPGMPDIPGGRAIAPPTYGIPGQPIPGMPDIPQINTEGGDDKERSPWEAIIMAPGKVDTGGHGQYKEAAMLGDGLAGLLKSMPKAQVGKRRNIRVAPRNSHLRGLIGG